MKIVLTVESSRHKQNRGKNHHHKLGKNPKSNFDTEVLVSRIRKSSRDLAVASGEARAVIKAWLAGAATIYGLVTNTDGSALLKRLEEETALSHTAEDAQFTANQIVFKEGRSTPVPPRPPGAQRQVE